MLSQVEVGDGKMKYVTFTNIGSIELCNNFLQSVKNLGMEKNVIVYCLDFDSRKILERNFDCEFRLFGTDSIEASFHSYGSEEFRTVTKNKIEIILDALQGNESIVYTDCDVVFRKSPTQFILDNDNDSVDIFFATDAPFMKMCTGFMYVKNRESIHRLFHEYFSHNEKYDEVKNEHMFDQEIINGILQNNQTGVTYGVYPLEFVSNGHIYFSESIQTGNEYVVHANFTIGKDNKINKLKGANLWVGD